MRLRLPTRLCRYEPRLLSRSTTILKPSSKTCCSIVSSTLAGAIGFSASRFGVRFRVEGVSARTGAILIVARNLWRRRGQWRARSRARRKNPNRKILADGPAVRRYLHNALAKELVLSGKQILHEIETAFIGIARGAGDMMIDF